MKKQYEYMIRKPKGRKLDPTTKLRNEQVSRRELDEKFGGELCQTDSGLKY